MVISRVDLDYE